MVADQGSVLKVLWGPEVRPEEEPLRNQTRWRGTSPASYWVPRTTRSVRPSPLTLPATRPCAYQLPPVLSILLTLPVPPALVNAPRYSQVFSFPITARSGEPSPVKSPVATSRPKWPPAPDLGARLVPPDRPDFEPQTMVTLPRYSALPTCSLGLPTTRSA